MPDSKCPENESSWASFCGLLAAGAVAAFIEVALFLPSGSALPPGQVIHHLVWLLVVYLIGGAIAASVSEVAVGMTLLFGPSIVAASPLVVRQLGPGVLVAIVVVTLIAARQWRSRASAPLLLTAALGAFLGVRTTWFFTNPWDGRNTAVGPVLVLLSAAGLSVGLYAASTFLKARSHYAPATSLLVGAAATLGCLGLAFLSGSGIPATVEGTVTWDAAPPVVVIVLDAVRADHLGAYGYRLDTMPRLEQFAEFEGVLVDRAISNAPDSLSAHASLFTGLFPTNHGGHRPLVTDDDPPPFAYPLRADVPTLAEVFRDFGYATLAVSGNFGPVGPGFGLDRGFGVYHAVPDGACEFGKRSPWRPVASRLSVLTSRPDDAAPWGLVCERRYRRATVIVDDAIALLEAAGDSSFFLFVNLFDAHSPYSPPADFRDRFATASRTPGQPSRVGSDGETEALYDGELAYLDEQLERLLQHLREHPAWDEMLVIITADHGEAFGEHGLWDHSTTLYDEMIRVPMIIKLRASASPDLRPGDRLQRPMQLVDVMPVALSHAGINVLLDLDGRDLQADPAFLRAWSFVSQAKIEAMPELRRELRSVEAGGWKLIEAFPGSMELYDLTNDPGETRNLAAERPGVRDELAELLGSRDKSYRELFGRGAVSDPETLQRLRALGYIR